MSGEHTLGTRGVHLGYEGRAVVTDLDLVVPPGRVTMIVGPNACGKSTTLRAMARLLAPTSGVILLDGKDIQKVPTRQVAAVLGILPQSPVAPDGILVADLVARGRYPHQGWLRRWSVQDDAAVAEAMAATSVLELADRPVDSLSGGQRQRVWIAMALAQRTDLLLLDEPTTYLDVAHQLEVLDLLIDLNQHRGTTVVVVLHDLNLACRYADHLIAMRAGQVLAEGRPTEVVTGEMIEQTFGMRCSVVPDPISGTPMIVPIGRHRVQDVAVPEST